MLVDLVSVTVFVCDVCLDSFLSSSSDIAPDYTLVEVTTGSSRQRREAGEHVVLHLQLFNKSMKVDLHRSNIASKSYVLQEMGVDGELHDVPHHETDCYFSGYIEGEPDSHVTISLCEDDKMVCVCVCVCVRACVFVCLCVRSSVNKMIHPVYCNCFHHRMAWLSMGLT